MVGVGSCLSDVSEALQGHYRQRPSGIDMPSKVSWLMQHICEVWVWEASPGLLMFSAPGRHPKAKEGLPRARKASSNMPEVRHNPDLAFH